MPLRTRLILLLMLLVAAGCEARAVPPAAEAPPAVAEPPAARESAHVEDRPRSQPRETASAPDAPSADAATPALTAPPDRAPAGSDAAAHAAPESTPAPHEPHGVQPPAIDDDQLDAAGIRKLSGKHLTLYTDLPPKSAVDELVDAFDQACPQWCDYFGVSTERAPTWHLIGCVIGDKQRFIDAGLLPEDLPPFAHAYSRGGWLWVYDQPTDYYRRHLLLHEGTHAFEDSFFDSNGPPWYSEGMAELLGTHRWKDGRVTLNYFPADADHVPGWGRIRLVHDAINADHRLTLDEVMAYDDRAHIDVEPYGWCWAAAALLERHPRYAERFRKLPPRIKSANFNREVRALYADDWAQLAEEWQLFTADLDYGYDFDRAAIDFRAGKPLIAAGATVTIAADRGWQSSGVLLDAGKTYRLTAAGRYQVAREPRPWMCEPEGVTIRYWRGAPLGALLAAVHPDDADPRADSPLLTPAIVGREAVLRPQETGTLYLRINDSSAELADNAGTVEVRIEPE